VKRDLARLARERFDLLVVGGGITGAAAAADAAERGLATALVERGDFGGATSANSLKILHGGLRSLQHLDLGRFRESVEARRRVLARFPDLVAPLPCVVPTRGFGARGRPALAAALALNDRLAAARNRGVPARAHLPGGRTLSRRQLADLAPGIDLRGASGGALWHDAIALDSERIVLGYVLAAAAAGAAVANHLGAEAVLARRGRVEGVRVRDGITGERFDVRARAVVNAAGPWIPGVDGPEAAATVPVPLVRAVNVIVGRRLFGRAAVGLECARPGGGSRFLFFVPWRGGTMIGTLYRDHAGPAADSAADPRDVEELLEEANRAHPGGRIGAEEVRRVHVGLLPAAAGAGPPDTRLLTRPRLEGGAGGPAGFVAALGVKYTTGPLLGPQAVDLALRSLGRSVPPPAPPPAPAPVPKTPSGVAAPLASRLLRAYGSAAGPLLDAVGADPTRGRRLVRGQPATAAEVVHAVRAEMALTLADVVFGRTGLGTFSHPGGEAIALAAAVAGAELGWDDGRRRREVEAVEAEFRRLGGTPA